MSRPRSDLLGSLGKLFSIFKKVADAVLELGGSDEDIAKIDSSEYEHLPKEIARQILGQEPIFRKSSRNGWAIEEAYWDRGAGIVVDIILSVSAVKGTHYFYVGQPFTHKQYTGEMILGSSSIRVVQKQFGRVLRIECSDDEEPRILVDVGNRIEGKCWLVELSPGNFQRDGATLVTWANLD